MDKQYGHWTDETALKIIREKGEKPCYTCASGITPSGTVYIGNFEVDVETLLSQIGISPEYIYQAHRYRASRYTPGIRTTLEHRGTPQKILNAFRDEEHQIQEDWWSGICSPKPNLALSPTSSVSGSFQPIHRRTGCR